MTDLCGEESQGTLIGTIVYGRDTSLSVPSGYSYIGLRSDSGALYLSSVSIIWSNGDASIPYYAVTVNSSEHGSVEASRETAPEGASVQLTVKPEDGYMLDTLTVTDANDTELLVTNNAFQMPDSAVMVDATFVRLPPVDYLDEAGELRDTGDDLYHFVTKDAMTINDNKLTSGWWVVEEDVKPDSRLTVEGDVKLILVDGATLTANQGILVSGTDSLTIYGQTAGSGTLVAKGGTSAAGIGGKGGESGGTITINGGTVTATGCKGSGVGKDSAGGAGIGGGNGASGGTITINGGTVTATGKACAAGIGGGADGAGGAITINGGAVHATGGGYEGSPEVSGGAGIGGGASERAGTIVIAGGKVTAQGSTDAAGIGPGGGCSSEDGACGTVTLSLSGGDDYVTSNTYVNNYGGSALITVALPDGSEASVTDADNTTAVYTGVLNGDDLAAIAGKTLVKPRSAPTSIEGAQVSAIDDQAYTGSAITPEPTVTLDGVELVKDVEYELSYDNNVEEGAATITITGIGAYCGTVTTTFNIVVAPEPAGPEFTTAQLTLGKQIVMRFGLSVPEDVDASDGTAVFEIGGKSARTSGPMPLSEADTSADTGTRGFYFELSSIEMAEPVTCTFTYGGGGESVTLTSSVADYIAALDKYSEEHRGEIDPNMLSCVHAVANYGHYVQQFLEKHSSSHWVLGVDYKEMTQYYADLNDVAAATSELGKQSPSVTGAGAELVNVTCSLSLDSLTTLFVYVAPKEGTTGVSITSATFNGKTVDPVLQADGRYLVRVEGVEAYNLNQVLAIGGTAGDEAFSISARPLDYAGIVLSGDYDGLSKNAMAALYHYYFWSNQVR